MSETVADAAARPLIRVSGPVKASLDAIKARLEGERDRQVTYSEVIEQLLAGAR